MLGSYQAIHAHGRTQTHSIPHVYTGRNPSRLNPVLSFIYSICLEHSMIVVNCGLDGRSGSRRMDASGGAGPQPHTSSAAPPRASGRACSMASRIEQPTSRRFKPSARRVKLVWMVHARERGDGALGRALLQRAGACQGNHVWHDAIVGYTPHTAGGTCRICMRGPPWEGQW
jgi:hypothetical protein